MIYCCKLYAWPQKLFLLIWNYGSTGIKKELDIWLFFKKVSYECFLPHLQGQRWNNLKWHYFIKHTNTLKRKWWKIFDNKFSWMFIQILSLKQNTFSIYFFLKDHISTVFPVLHKYQCSWRSNAVYLPLWKPTVISVVACSLKSFAPYLIIKSLQMLLLSQHNSSRDLHFIVSSI